MTDTVIHNTRVSYDEDDERVRAFVKHLKNIEMKEEFRNSYEKARHGSEDKRVYLSDSLGNEFTLECEGEHICNLRLRGM